MAATFSVCERHGPSKPCVLAAGFISSDEALAWVGSKVGEIIFAEEDADYPLHFDVFAGAGRVLTIQPVTT